MTYVFFLERGDVSQALFWVGRFLVLINGEVSFPDERSFFLFAGFLFRVLCLRLYMVKIVDRCAVFSLGYLYRRLLLGV